MEFGKFLQSLSRNEESCSASQLDAVCEVLFAKRVVEGSHDVAKQCTSPVSQKPLRSVSGVDSHYSKILLLLGSQVSVCKCLSQIVSCVVDLVISELLYTSFLYILSVLSLLYCDDDLTQSSSITKLSLTLMKNISKGSDILIWSMEQVFDTFLSVDGRKSRLLASRNNLVVDSSLDLSNFRQMPSEFEVGKSRKMDGWWLGVALSHVVTHFFSFPISLILSHFFYGRGSIDL